MEPARGINDTVRELLAYHERIRKEWADSVHNELGGSVTAIRTHASAAKEMVPDAREAVERMENIEKECVRMQAFIKHMETSLYSVTYARHGVHEGVRELMREIEQSGLKAVLEWQDEQQDYEPRVSTALYRIVQEAATNTIKHAKASEFRVTVARIDEAVQVTIKDNGIGLGPGVFAKGRGIWLMDERAKAAGGRFGIMSAQGRGTTVTVVFPYPGKSIGGDAAQKPVRDSVRAVGLDLTNAIVGVGSR